MKTFAIGVLALVVMVPASIEAAPGATPAVDKFESVVRLNYTHASGSRVASGAYRGHRGGYAYRGGYYGRGPYGGYSRGGRYGYRYPYYGYGGWYGGYYPYWGYGGFPSYSGFAYGAGWPLAYYGGSDGAGPYLANQQPLLLPPMRTVSTSRGSGGSFITKVQSALKTRGYYAGPVDGDFGPSSQKAFASFQQASGLPATGTLDSPALAALGVGGKSAKSKPTSIPPRKSTDATFEPPPIGPPDQPPAITPQTPPVAPPGQPPVIPREPPAIPGGT